MILTKVTCFSVSFNFLTHGVPTRYTLSQPCLQFIYFIYLLILIVQNIYINCIIIYIIYNNTITGYIETTDFPGNEVQH